MARHPTNEGPESSAKLVTQELREVIRAHAPGKFKAVTEGRYRKGQKDGRYLRPEDVEEVILGLVLRLTSKEIMAIVNSSRVRDGLEEVKETNLTYYRQKYADLIDEVYATAVLRIGEIYSYADKMVRIARYNEMADIFRREVMIDSRAGEMDELTVKKANVLLRIMDRLNVEMGAVPLNKMIVRHQGKSESDEEEFKDVPMTKEEAKQLLIAAMSDRYKGQLPDAISEKISFTDYSQCANGEELGGITVCWNHIMTDGNRGGQCPVQSGKVKKCPKFLNKSLLENKEWLVKARENGITIAKIAALVGCEQYDVEVRNTICYYLKNFDIIKRVPNRSLIENEEETIDDIDSEQENVIEVE